MRFGVAEFSTAHHGLSQRRRLIGLDFSASYPRRDRAQTLKSINRSLTGFEAALPDNYGWGYAKLRRISINCESDTLLPRSEHEQLDGDQHNKTQTNANTSLQ